MGLSSGTYLGPYELLAPLGAGGMGEVYRARDRRLGRDVAVKVLPALYSENGDRLRRFEQEARAAGQLNHPNVLTVHDLGAHDGSPYLITELLEGETLRGRLRNGPLSPRKAIDYATQLASGLSAAHSEGIVHRDLKPENIFITRDGRLKILDFGLAKLTRDDGGTDQNQPVPVRHGSAGTAFTSAGVVLGTTSYMSPEQVRGEPVDHRSDIFALGAILYEMLSGHRAFQRESAAETMVAILREDPPVLADVNPAISPSLERIIQHSLEKEPEERFQSAKDLGLALDAVSQSSAPNVPAPTHRLRKRRLKAALVAVGLLAAGLLGLMAGRIARQERMPTFRQLTFRRGAIWSARFGPDGQTIVYGAAWEGNPVEVFMNRLDSTEWRSAGFPSSDVLALSRSGEMALSLRRHSTNGYVSIGTLARVPLAGGAPREVLEEVQSADWSPDGTQLAVIRQIDGRNRLEYPIGNVVYETVGWLSHARVSPDGQAVAFLHHPFPGDDSGALMLVQGGGSPHVVSDGWYSIQGLAWAPKGNEVWFTATKSGANKALHAVTRSGRLRLVARIPGSLTLQDIYADYRVLLTRDNWRVGISALVPGAARERDLSWLDWSLANSISADGKAVLFDESGEAAGGAYYVYIRNTAGGPAVRLGVGAAVGLSWDGRWALAFNTQSPHQLLLLPTGAGQATTLDLLVVAYQDWGSWLPDGKQVIFAGSEPGKKIRGYRLAVGGGGPQPFTPEGIDARSVGQTVSPDGTAAVFYNPDRIPTLYPLDGSNPRPIPGTSHEDMPLNWSADGRALYIRQRGKLPARIERLILTTGAREFVRELMPPDSAGVVSLNGISATPDWSAYAYSYSRFLSDLYLVEGLR